MRKCAGCHVARGRVRRWIDGADGVKIMLRSLRLCGVICIATLLCGCSHYMGYHYVDESAHSATAAQSGSGWSGRVHTYGRYSLSSDLIEPFCWVFGPLMACQEWYYGPYGVAKFDPRMFCIWPPIDLAARICGSAGFKGVRIYRREGGLYADHDAFFKAFRYDRVPPSYGRRLLQWWAWVVPGYNIDHDSTFEVWGDVE